MYLISISSSHMELHAYSALQDYDLQSPGTLGFLCSEGILATLCNILETSGRSEGWLMDVEDGN